MKILISDFYKNLLQETGTSFIFGTATAAVKGILVNDSNILIKQVQALRKGTEHAQYTLLFNVLVYAFTRLRLRAGYASALSLFLSSYVAGKRNGFLFGVKNGVFGLVMSVLGQVFG